MGLKRDERLRLSWAIRKFRHRIGKPRPAKASSITRQTAPWTHRPPASQAANRAPSGVLPCPAFLVGGTGGSAGGNTSVEVTGSGSVATRRDKSARVITEKIIAWLVRHWVRAPELENVPIHPTTPRKPGKLQWTKTIDAVVSTAEGAKRRAARNSARRIKKCPEKQKRLPGTGRRCNSGSGNWIIRPGRSCCEYRGCSSVAGSFRTAVPAAGWSAALAGSAAAGRFAAPM